MTVTEIKKIGKGLRYNLYVDEQFEGVFEAEVLARYQLKTGSEIDKEFLNSIKIENGNLACFDRALSVLEKGMKTEKGLKDYLVGKFYPIVCIEEAIKKLKEYGYINDEIFAENFIRSYIEQKGSKRLKFELLTKGVSQEIIEQKLEELIDPIEQRQACKKHAQKYMRGKENDLKTMQKLLAHLVSKGYEYELAMRVIKEVRDVGD